MIHQPCIFTSSSRRRLLMASMIVATSTISACSGFILQPQLGSVRLLSWEHGAELDGADGRGRASTGVGGCKKLAMSSRVRMVPKSKTNRSRALPFLPQPESLDGTMIGDVGFDPLGLATPENLPRFREAELKHGRLAMVGLAGWPVATIILGFLTGIIPPETVCTHHGCAIDEPLAGSALSLEAIGRISWVYWGSAFVLSVAAELVSLRRKQRNILPPSGYQAGDLGLDPFGLADDEMRLKELKHGRLAMAAFAFHYAGVLLEKKGIVNCLWTWFTRCAICAVLRLTILLLRVCLDKVGHQLWGDVCIYNLGWGLSSLPPPICYPRPESGFDTTLSWEIMWRVLTGFFKEPYY